MNADIVKKENRIYLTGTLNFYNVMSIYQHSLSLLNTPALEFDFSGVESSDSAGLALIIEWIKYAGRKNKKIKFHHLSKDILSLATAADLDKLIPTD